MLIVNPKTHMIKNAEMMDTGSVRPVITVERQEFRNRKMMAMVSSAPSTIENLTSFNESRMRWESSRMRRILTSGGT